MNLGYHKPLYLLPFDHRHSYVTGSLFNFKPPLTPEQHDQVADSKQVIYEGFKQALAAGVPPQSAGILVDEEFGAAILRDAANNGYTTALSTETSGQAEFDFEYGKDFIRHIEAFDPTFVKVLVRYNPEGEAASNQRQTARLQDLSAYCRRSSRLFMFELLVPATQAQLDRVQQDTKAYDLQIRPALMVQTIQALQNAGVDPDIWKVEGLERRTDCMRIVETVRQAGRSNVSCIVLGRGADEKKEVAWLEVAAAVPGFIGFAVGRTTFWDAIADYEAKTVTRQAAAARIAARYREWVDIFERARRLQQGAA